MHCLSCKLSFKVSERMCSNRSVEFCLIESKNRLKEYIVGSGSIEPLSDPINLKQKLIIGFLKN